MQVHLGRLGHFKYHGKTPADPTPGVRMRLAHAAETIDLVAPITCKLVTADARAAALDRLGPDPLSPDFDEAAAREVVWAKVSGSRKAVAGLLLDQGVFAGTGLIFATEALLRVGLRPDTAGRDVPRAVFDRLFDDNVRLMRLATEVGRIVGVERSDVDKPPAKLKQEERFLIYKRDACRRCGTPAEAVKANGREVRYCPKHQVKP